MQRGGKLIEPVNETEWEQACYSIVTAKSQISRDDTNTSPKVRVTREDSLWLASRSGSVSDLSGRIRLGDLGSELLAGGLDFLHHDDTRSGLDVARH